LLNDLVEMEALRLKHQAVLEKQNDQVINYLKRLVQLWENPNGEII